MDPVTEVLRGRLRADGGIERMMALSLAVHAVVLALVIASATLWRGPQMVTREVMSISLGGTEGPEIGGMTPIAARPVQRAVADLPARPSLRAPTGRAPEMTVPAPAARPRAESAAAATDGARRSRTPTVGEEVRAGTAVGETAGRGQGFGLSSGGGQGLGSRLDVGNFCCPEYLTTMQQLIRRNWNEAQPVQGTVLVKFTILRDGTFAAVELERSSGYSTLDIESQRALALTRQLPPLPAAFPDSRLTVHLEFRYSR
jgi:TonB family protein